MQLDVSWVRGRFPAFSEPSLDGWAFFENAGGSYPCAPVVERLERFYRQRKVQPYAPYPASELAGAEMDEARVRLAAMLNVEEDELSFGPSTTQNVYVLANAFRRWLPEGAAIVVTDQDHEANSGAWRRLAEDGFEIREWRIDPETGHLAEEDLIALLSDGRVRLVCFPHCSNVVGEINDVAAICALAHEAGAVTCVDGVSYAPHGLPDVGALDTDIYMFSAYKTYGPHQGILCTSRELGMALPNQGHGFNGDSLYKRFTPAGPDHAQVAACAGIADYIDEVAAHLGVVGDARERSVAVSGAMRAREIALVAPLLDWARERNDVRLIGTSDPDQRAPTIALRCAEPGEAVAAKLAEHRIMAGGGDFYAVRPLAATGVDPAHGVLRLSLVHYTTEDEVARAVEALEAVL